MKFSVGITTAKRENLTLDRCLVSYNGAFITNCTIFAEPDVDKIETNNKWISRERQYGCWDNWIFSLRDLYKSGPESEFYCIFQDDIVFCKNIESYLGTIELPKIFSIFKPRVYSKNEGVWSKQDRGGSLWMAQTLFIHRSIIPSLLTDRTIWKLSGNKQIDNRVGMWAKKIGQQVYYHCPSLCQHIGEKSTIWNDANLDNYRSADDFVGEEFVCVGK